MKFIITFFLMKLSLFSILSAEDKAAQQQLQETLSTVEKQDLAVLYAGDPKDIRTADFKRFLQKHFREVGTISYEKFIPASMDDFDVVIFDWGKVSFVGDNVLRMPKLPKLPQNFSRPMMLIASLGILIAEKLGARLDWM